mgnify:CR=1 FL=1
MDNRNISLPAKILVYAIMIIFTVLTIYPILWLVLQSFKTNTTYLTTNKLSFPSSLYLGNYAFVMNQGNFFGFFKNSLIYTSVTVAVVVVLSNMAGFAFAKLNYKITKLLHGIFIVGILLTMQSILIPLFLMVSAAGIHNTRWAVLIPYIALGLPMGVYLCTDFQKSIPDELLEAARIDGASFISIFSRVVLPMCAPVSVTLAIITFTGNWNDFMGPLIYLSSDAKWTLALGLSRFSGMYGKTPWNLLMAASLVTVLPCVLLFFFAQRYFIQGIVITGVKG